MTKEKKQMLYLFALSIIISIIVGKFVGKVVYSFLKPISGLGPQLQCPECIDGFLISYLFFVSLFFNLLKFKSKNKIWLVLLLPIILFINPPYEFFIIAVCLIVVAWLLAQGGLIIHKRAKK